MKTSFRGWLAPLLVALPCGASFAASSSIECPSGAMSNSARNVCLTQKLAELDVQLQGEVTSLIGNLPNSGLWEFHDQEEKVAFLKRRAESIELAHTQWRRFLEAECLVASGVFEGGSGEDTYKVECHIEKTLERISFLRSHEPYKSFRKVKTNKP